jgi:DNA repair protein RecO (recombination protein O)
MLNKTQCVVLSHVKYGDSSLIVRVLTHDFGRQSLLVHGVRKKRPKYNPYLFEPFSLLDIDFYFKQNRDLHTLRETKPAVALNQLYFDIRKSTIAIFLAELISKSLQEVEVNPSLFDFIFHAVQILDVAEDGIENFHLIFLLELSKYVGIYPGNNQDLHQFLTEDPVQITDLLEFSLSDIGKLKLSQKNKISILEMLVKYYRFNLEGMGTIKSLPILKTVFQD